MTKPMTLAEVFLKDQPASGPIQEGESLRVYFARIGAIGGKRSKRKLTADQARAMVIAREAKRGQG